MAGLLLPTEPGEEKGVTTENARGLLQICVLALRLALQFSPVFLVGKKYRPGSVVGVPSSLAYCFRKLNFPSSQNSSPLCICRRVLLFIGLGATFPFHFFISDFEALVQIESINLEQNILMSLCFKETSNLCTCKNQRVLV